MLCLEHHNEDYDSDDITSAVVRRTLGPTDYQSQISHSSRTAKPKLVAAAARPRSVTFRPAGDEIKNMVITNAMVSRRQEEATEQVNKYGVNVINERALGKVVDFDNNKLSNR